MYYFTNLPPLYFQERGIKGGEFFPGKNKKNSDTYAIDIKIFFTFVPDLNKKNDEEDHILRFNFRVACF
jgi:hypothetical protein